MKNRATEALLKIGLPMSTLGFNYIVRAMELYDNGMNNCKTMDLYEQIARDYNTDYRNIERTIRYALTFIVIKGCKDEAVKYFDLRNTKNSAQLPYFYYRLCREREAEKE